MTTFFLSGWHVFEGCHLKDVTFNCPTVWLWCVLSSLSIFVTLMTTDAVCVGMSSCLVLGTLQSQVFGKNYI